MWGDPAARQKALRILKFKSKYKSSISSDALLSLLANQTCSVSFFRPSAAKAVYQVFNAKNVYDLSCGWGDRLIGALATRQVQSYWGTDPNVGNQEIYKSICQNLKRPATWLDLDVHIATQPAEEYKPPAVDGQERRFDLVFTSIPYFNTERYAEGTPYEGLQSWFRYKTLDEWLKGFALPAIRNAVSVLIPGGVLAINVANCKQNGAIIPLVESIKNLLSTASNLTFKGQFGYRLSARYGAKALGQGMPHAEPILIWSLADAT